MFAKKSRYLICVVLCVTLIVSQTLVSIGSEPQPSPQAGAISTEGAINDNLPSDTSGGVASETGDANSSNGDDETSLYPPSNFDATISPDEIEKIEALTVDPVKGAEFDGYLVNIKDSKVNSVDEEKKEEVIEDEVRKDIVVVETPEDAAIFVSASAIEDISPNYIVSTFAYPATDPNDPQYAKSQWGLKKINANVSWQNGYTGAGVNVAVIDTGLNADHADIQKSKVLDGKNFVDLNNISNQYKDDNGHGSLVTSIIAADTNNGLGMASMTEEANIISYKVLDQNGSGTLGNILKAYDALLKSGIRIDVLNLSLGHPGYNEEENAYIQQFINRGTIVVAAAGNDGTAAGAARNQISYPASYNNVIGVGSIDSNGTVSSFSTKNSSVDVSAPGGNMLGISSSDNYNYKTANGTSFASPVVASAAVVAKQYNLNTTSNDFLNILKSSATDVGSIGWDSSYGYGVLNMNAFFNTLRGVSGKVSFNGNGGSAVSTTKSIVTGTTYGALPTTSRSGYVFTGWYTAPSGGSYVSSSTIMNGTGSVVLYAHWSKIYTVSFNANGGKKVSTKKSVPVGYQYGSLPSASRSKYGLVGWYTKKTGGTKVTASSVMNTAGNTTLYARWGKKYTVKFNANKGKVKKKSKSVAKGTTYGALPTPTRKNYTFVGWYTKKSGGSKITNASVAKMKKTQTLYARWKKK